MHIPITWEANITSSFQSLQGISFEFLSSIFSNYMYTEKIFPIEFQLPVIPVSVYILHL